MLERLLINSEVKGKANDIRKLYFDINIFRIVNVRWDLRGLQAYLDVAFKVQWAQKVKLAFKDLMVEMDYQEKACKDRKDFLVHQVSECKDNPE